MSDPTNCPECKSDQICRYGNNERGFLCTDCSHEWIDPSAETFQETMHRKFPHLFAREIRVKSAALKVLTKEQASGSVENIVDLLVYEIQLLRKIVAQLDKDTQVVYETEKH